jgi:hypothetical protein
MKKFLFNWRTTILGGGILTSAVVSFAENPSDLKTVLVLGLTGLIGIFSKDAD